jgi:hypothetical protein
MHWLKGELVERECMFQRRERERYFFRDLEFASK